MTETLVPWLDRRASYLAVKEETDVAMQAVLDSGVYEYGEAVDAFEAAFAAFCGTKYAVTVNSGSAAILLSLKALGIGEGDEVISPANSCFSIPLAIANTGARPVLVDCEGATYNVDTSQIESLITPRTKAIMAIHHQGVPCDVDTVKAIAERHDLLVVEDAAVSTGARFKGRRVGSFGDVGVFSLASGKILSAFGGGGAVTTNDETVAAKVAQLTHYGKRAQLPEDGIDEAYSPSGAVLGEFGYNMHLSNIQAAALHVRLGHLEPWLEQRRAKVRRYNELLADLPVTLPDVPDHKEPVWRGYQILVPDRNRVFAQLQDRGIEAMALHTPPIHLQPILRNLGYQDGDFPVTEQICRDMISLPVYPELTEEQIQTVAGALREALT